MASVSLLYSQVHKPYFNFPVRKVLPFDVLAYAKHLGFHYQNLIKL